MEDDETKRVANLIRSQLGSLPVITRERCIYRVPEVIRKVKEECYRPTAVSIGPLYYGDPSLQDTKELKLKHLQCFLEHHKNAHSLEHYISWLREREHQIRANYSESIELPSDEFIALMLIDAAFIIYLFTWYWPTDEFFTRTPHPMADKYELTTHVVQDLFLEENQLPYFVLYNLYKEAFGAACPHISFSDLTCAAVSIFNVPGKQAAGTITNRVFTQPYTITHLVAFLRICCLPSTLRVGGPDFRNRDYEFPSSVSELSAAGVRFIAGDSKSLLDIKFSGGILEIPTISIQDTTESTFRSLTIYEMCHHRGNFYFLDYIFFLDSLIKTPEDVQILVRNRVIDNYIGSDEAVANLFNSLTQQITLGPQFYYSDVSRKINAYAKTRWHRWLAILRRDYFNHPWTIISVIYAVILLVLTIMQTICGFISNKSHS